MPVLVVLARVARRARALAGTGAAHAVDDGGEQVELARVLVLGEVVLARDGAEDLLGHAAGLLDERAELAGNLEVDHGLPLLLVRSCAGCRSHEQGALEDTRSTEVAEPPLVVEVLDEAVPAEELDRVRADLRRHGSR